jgi:signal transduction histidine kinase
MEKIVFGNKIPYILIVDDVLKNLQVLGTILEEEGYEIAVASNGFEALDIIKSDMPDLILLDITMPDMDGYEVCRRLKDDNTTKNIPVIFLTARTETEDIVNGFKIGGVDYVTKPFKKEELLSRIYTHLELTYSRMKLVLQNEELIKLNTEKNEFLGIAAHDLKNPLSAIKGLSEFVIQYKNKLDFDEIDDIANQIKDSSEYMFRLIVDLLDINAIEEGKLELSNEDCSVSLVLNQTVKRFEALAAKKNICILSNNLCSDASILIDTSRLQQVMDNLVSNALKFSPMGLRIWINAEFADDGNIIFQIKDEGPGISEDDKKKLFNKFAKLSARPTAQENSTGLGLSIVKKLIQLMEGEIWCESELGYGTSFKIKIKKYEE